MLPYQRASADFFIPDDFREDLHKKAEAALQTFANSTLPQQVEHFHSLVALDTNTQRGQSVFGYSSRIYKAMSARDGHLYALRRIEGFRLTNEQAIRNFQPWKRISSASVVRVHDAFTGKWFGDSSLIVVTDYHPLSQTLAEKYFAPARSNRGAGNVVPENDLWTYLVQLASALQSIHENGLAAQTVTASKVLVTAKGRVRLNGCGVTDIVRYEQKASVPNLQRADLQDLGRLLLSLASRNPAAPQNVEKTLQSLNRTYSERFRGCLLWLLSPPAPSPDDANQQSESPSSDAYTISNLLTNIADKLVAAFDSSLHRDDDLTTNLMRELENGRLARLLMKLNVILERPDNSVEPHAGNNRNAALLNQPSAAWSETGERYPLLLFRDYVFHQVDHEGRPVVNLGHIITCLNKLDAGIDEEVQLVSRDEQILLVVSYKALKRNLESAWAELSKAAAGGGRR
jgi:PAB-dependent poly(A)-specific ribonuclease subunit 3